MRKGTSRVQAALDVIVAELRGSMRAGAEFSGTLDANDGLEVEVTVRVRRSVSTSAASRYRKHAMALFEAHSWNDRCPAIVKNRGPWAVSKTTGCSGRVTTVIVRRGYDDEVGPMRPDERRRLVPGERYHFVCNHHADVAGDPDVLAVVKLEQSALRTLRAKRERESEERRARDREAERKLEAEVATLSEAELRARLEAAKAAGMWGAEDAIGCELRRRARSVA